MKIIIPSVDSIIQTNKFCSEMNGQNSVVLNKGKIESALHTSFYPGSERFQNGGIAKLAGALCYYLTKAMHFRMVIKERPPMLPSSLCNQMDGIFNLLKTMKKSFQT